LKRFARKLELAILPTPIQPSGRLSVLLGSDNVVLKRDDLTGMALSGNKVRKLEYCAADAVARGSDILITCGGPQSNHARATAAVAAKLGMGCHLVLNGTPEALPEGNLFLDLLFGARTTFVSLPDLRDQAKSMEEIADAYRTEGHRPYVIPLGASDALGSLGYIDAIGEIADQVEKVGIIPDRIVFACGSGGTLSGIVAGCLVHGLNCRVTAISVAFPSQWFDEKVDEVFSGLREKYIPELPRSQGKVRGHRQLHRGGLREGLSGTINFISDAASLEAVLLDPTYTGKALFGLMKEIEMAASTRTKRSSSSTPAASSACSHTGKRYWTHSIKPSQNEGPESLFSRES
jgi:D-cysteine desulfhydrase